MTIEFIKINKDLTVKGSRKEIVIHPPTDITIPATTICTEGNIQGGVDTRIDCVFENTVYSNIIIPKDMFKDKSVEIYNMYQSGGRRTKRRRILRRRTRRRAVKRKNKKTRR